MAPCGWLHLQTKVWIFNAFSMLTCLPKAKKNKSQDGIIISIDVMCRITTYHLKCPHLDLEAQKKVCNLYCPTTQRTFFVVLHICRDAKKKKKPRQGLMDTPGKLIHSAGILVQSEACVWPLFGCHGVGTNVLSGSKCAAPSDLAGRASSCSQWGHDPMVSLQSAECPDRQQDPHPAWHMVVRNWHSLQPKTDDQPGHLPTHGSSHHLGLKTSPSWPPLTSRSPVLFKPCYTAASVFQWEVCSIISHTGAGWLL